MITTDCLIIGGGLSGWMAAREAVAQNLDTLMLQDGMGASPWVHGISVPVHPEDSPDVFLADTLASGQGLCDPALARALCMDAPGMLEQVQSLGLELNRENGGYQLLRPLGASQPRVVSIGNETGVAVLGALGSQLAGRVRQMPHTRALRLYVREGRVAGALAYTAQEDGGWAPIAARAVVLACGGFCRMFPVSTNKRDSGGDGAAMAFYAGAQLCDMEFVQFEPSAAVWPPQLLGTSVITTMFFEGAVLRNCQGERFMLRHGPQGERVGKDVMARRIAAEIAAGQGTAHGGVYFDATGVGKQRLEEGYASYVKRYQAVGMDLATDWIELAPAPHTSLGGVRIDENGGTTVPGLFACGEVIGGLHGANRIGGNAGLETLVFGIRAGRGAAAYARDAALPSLAPSPPVAGGACIASRLSSLRENMSNALGQGASALRDGASLAKSLHILESGLGELQGLAGADAAEVFQRLRLENDMITALMVLKAARAREDSLGCHARADFPQKADAPYRLVIARDGAGAISIRKEDLG